MILASEKSQLKKHIFWAKHYVANEVSIWSMKLNGIIIQICY